MEGGREIGREGGREIGREGGRRREGGRGRLLRLTSFIANHVFFVIIVTSAPVSILKRSRIRFTFRVTNQASFFSVQSTNTEERSRLTSFNLWFGSVTFDVTHKTVLFRHFRLCHDMVLSLHVRLHTRWSVLYIRNVRQVSVVLLQILQRFHLLAAVDFEMHIVRGITFRCGIKKSNTPLTCSPVSRILYLLLVQQTSLCERLCLLVVPPCI